MQKRGEIQWPRTSAGKAIIEQHTAAEVEAMSPDEALAVRGGTAIAQRNVPEHKMMELQRTAGGGVMPNAAEHVGDLTHRMNQPQRTTDIIMEDVVPKVRNQSANLGSRYGFEREHEENITGNARYTGADVEAHRAAVQSAGQEYADAHRKVPVYNYPTEVARDAAVSLGEQRFSDTRTHLDHLSRMQTGGKGYAAGDMESLLHQPRSGTAAHQQGMVDYLRGKEADTPAITQAATVMLGGRRQH